MKNRNLIVIATGAVLVAVVAFFLLNSSASTPAAVVMQDISPVAYQDQFISPGAAHLLIDVRTPEEFASGHIQGAINIPVDALAGRLSEVPASQPVVVYCRSGNRSATASQILAQAGYSRVYDLGGIIDWTAQGFPVE